jgi:sec-independent protein translocase protein TatB
MFDIGWTELVVIGVVALIVIGPRDLPEMFRTLGRFTAKLRSMSRDFSRAMEAAAKESGVQDVARDLKSATSAKSMGLDAVKDAASRFEKWDPLKNAAKPTNPAAVGARPTPTTTPAPAAAPVVAETAAAQTVATEKVAATVGPETKALAQKVSARKAIAEEAAAKLRAVNAGTAPAEAAAPEPAAPAKKPGRTRKPKTPSTDTQA